VTDILSLYLIYYPTHLTLLFMLYPLIWDHGLLIPELETD